MTKLTLSVDEAVVEKAKQIAEANGTSVSAMFSQFVRSFSARKGRRARVGPVTRSVTGIMRWPGGKKFDYKKELTDALMERYGLRK